MNVATIFATMKLRTQYALNSVKQGLEAVGFPDMTGGIGNHIWVVGFDGLRPAVAGLVVNTTAELDNSALHSLRLPAHVVVIHVPRSSTHVDLMPTSIWHSHQFVLS